MTAISPLTCKHGLPAATSAISNRLLSRLSVMCPQELKHIVSYNHVLIHSTPAHAPRNVLRIQLILSDGTHSDQHLLFFSTLILSR